MLYTVDLMKIYDEILKNNDVNNRNDVWSTIIK